MKFRTEIEIGPWPRKIDYSHRIVSLGSCFADNIARELSRRKFRVVASPTGILFNPRSIADAAMSMTQARVIGCDELIESDGRYLHYDFHSSISGSTREQATEAMNEALRRGGEALSHADYLIVTLGTAWAYRLVDSSKVVANCHRQPAAKFRRELLTVDEIASAIETLLASTSAHIILTISPVRHLGEGLADNSLSKALLRVAIEKACQRSERLSYFPSFEIMMDDLRDYRFYGEDLVHPSPTAIAYIAEKFFSVATTPATRQLMERIERIVRATEHRALNPNSQAYRELCRRMLGEINSLAEIDFLKEKEHFEQMLQINL